MILIKRVKNSLLVIFSVAISFLLIEFSYLLIIQEEERSSFNNRTILFDAGANFQNFNGFFKYQPNASIRTVTLYSWSKPTEIDDLIIEYDYIIYTNNAGLVMRGNLNHHDDVLFVIGDSLTEGQGASPWFYDLEDNVSFAQLKIVNLGILGTGPQQWDELARFITGEFDLNVKASVVNIIPDDMKRDPWKFNERQIRCLRTAECDYSLGFQGFRFVDDMVDVDIRESVLEQLLTTAQPSIDDSQWFKNLLKKSRVIVDIYSFINQSIAPYHDSAFTRNERALIALKSAVSDNIFVNVLSQNSIKSLNYEKYTMARNLIRFLENNDFNFSWCDIPSNGFHIHDAHPNEQGYEVVRECTENAVKILQH